MTDELMKEDRCPHCDLNWSFDPPAAVSGSNLVRCIECKSTFPATPAQTKGDDLVAAAWEVQFQGAHLISNIQDVAEQYRTDGHLVEDLVRRSEAVSRIQSLTASNEALTKDLEAQIAGHRHTALLSTENLVRANTATAKLDEVEQRARKHWQAFRDLRILITGDGPMCRDCADENGRCPHSGQPCDPDEAVAEQIATWKAAQAEIARMREALEPYLVRKLETYLSIYPGDKELRGMIERIRTALTPKETR